MKAIICYNYPAVALWRLKNQCQSINVKFIADVTEWFGPSNKRFPLNIVKDIDTKLRMEYIHRRLEYLICISRYLYDYYKERVDHCILLPGTIDKNDVKWAVADQYIPNDVITLGYAGESRSPL